MATQKTRYLLPEVITERVDQDQQSPLTNQADQMPDELKDLFGFTSETPPGVIESWLDHRRQRFQLQQQQRTLQEEHILYALQAQRDQAANQALEERVKHIGTRIASGLLSTNAQTYLKQRFPDLWQNAQDEAERLKLDRQITLEERLTTIAKHKADRARYDRSTENSKMGHYYSEWRDLSDRVTSDLKGTAQGLTRLAKELKRLQLEIDHDPELVDGERTLLKQKLEQQFKNLSATWGRR